MRYYYVNFIIERLIIREWRRMSSNDPLMTPPSLVLLDNPLNIEPRSPKTSEYETDYLKKTVTSFICPNNV